MDDQPLDAARASARAAIEQLEAVKVANPGLALIDLIGADPYTRLTSLLIDDVPAFDLATYQVSLSARHRRVLLEALGRWIDTYDNTARPDLAAAGSRERGVVFQKELENYVAEISGKAVTGNNSLGIDLPEFAAEVKWSNDRRPQAETHFRSSLERVIGLGCHLVVLTASFDDDGIVQVGQATVVEARRTADHRLSVLAEHLRQGIHKGTVTLDDAIVTLKVEGVDPCNELVALLTGPDAIPKGELTLSANPSWHVSFRSNVLNNDSRISGVHTVRHHRSRIANADCARAKAARNKAASSSAASTPSTRKTTTKPRT